MRPLLLTVLLLTTATSLSAQFRPTISLSAGSNISTVRWYNPFELNGQTIPSNEYDETAFGFQAGLSVELPISSTFGVVVSPTFSRRGFSANEEISGVASRVRLDYFDLPVLFRVAPIDRFFIEAGPAISYMFRAETIEEGKPVGNEEILGKLYNDFDLSAVLGLGYVVNERLTVNLRACHGFLTVIDAQFTDGNGESLVDGSEPKLLNQSLQLSVQYAILNP
ncbi:MAG: porin family protein [Phaeodactylibacter sp.]|uniref:porin family protein n=1 Tax=Phaeodactylibacter sp. TaxID=1940289 RepID=UPI0032EE6DCE